MIQQVYSNVATESGKFLWDLDFVCTNSSTSLRFMTDFLPNEQSTQYALALASREEMPPRPIRLEFFGESENDFRGEIYWSNSTMKIRTSFALFQFEVTDYWVFTRYILEWVLYLVQYRSAEYEEDRPPLTSRTETTTSTEEYRISNEDVRPYTARTEASYDSVDTILLVPENVWNV